MSKWLSMDMAPKDRMIMACTVLKYESMKKEMYFPFTVQWKKKIRDGEDKGNWYDAKTGYSVEGLTHWMELPGLPEETIEESAK